MILPQWKNKKEAYKEALHYLKGRQEGKIKSWLTPFSKLNDAVVNGLEWHSLIILGGRPGSGKTAIKDQIINESFKLNPDMKFRVLEFSLEMVNKVSVIREFSSITSKSYKELCSADQKISNDIIIDCYNHAKKSVDNPIDIVNEAPTVEEFEAAVKQYMEEHCQVINEEGISKKIYTNTVITIDHSVLLRKSKHHSTSTDMLYELGSTLTDLKRRYPIIFIVLSQLGRSIDTAERNENGKYGNYILESDLFGGDALMQHAEVVIGINRPALRKIKLFGPDKYIIDDDNILVWHFLKCRNGDLRMSFFKAEFHKMKISEISPPAKASRI
jgi:replicative DNA helicase